MTPIWDALPSRETQDFIFSSEGTMWLTAIMSVLTFTYCVFGPKPAVINATVGDEGDNDEEDSSLDGKKVNGERGVIRSGGNLVLGDVKVARRVEWVETPLGKVRVTIVGDETKRGKLVTFHDVGLNHYSCFGRFFGPGGRRRGEARDLKVWEQFCIYHIDAPGHEEEAKDLARSHLAPNHGGLKSDKDGEEGGMTMNALAGVVECVVTELKIGCFVGFGVGAGANVLLRVAVRRPEFVRALILIGADAKRATDAESWYYYTTLKIMEKYGMNGYALDMWTRLHYSASVCSVNNGKGSAQVKSYRQILTNDLNPKNLAAYLHAYKNRTSIDKTSDERHDHKNAPHDKVMETEDLVIKLRGSKVLLMASDGSAPPSWCFFLYGFSRVVPAKRLFELLDRGRTNQVATWTGAAIKKRGHLVTEEKPEDMYQVISLFLDGVGFMTSL